MAQSQAGTVQQRTSIPLPDRKFFRGMFTSYRRLLVFVKPYWKTLLVAGVILVFNSLIGLALPWIISRLVDTAFNQADLTTLNRALVALLAIAIAQAFMGFGQTYLIGRVGERVVANLRKALYEHLHMMPLRFFAATRVGELTSRLSNDVMTIQEAVTSTILSLVSQTVTLIGGIIIILVMSWQLTLVMLAIVPLAVLGMIMLGRIIRRLSKQVQDNLAEINATADEALDGCAHRQIVCARALRGGTLRRPGGRALPDLDGARQSARDRRPDHRLPGVLDHRHRALGRRPAGDLRRN